MENIQKATYSSGNIDKLQLENKKLELNAGLIGKVFGTANPAVNISGIILLILIISGIVLAFISNMSEAIEYWKIISPLITAALGYIFGNGTKN